jgi:hypothetical protein
MTVFTLVLSMSKSSLRPIKAHNVRIIPLQQRRSPLPANMHTLTAAAPSSPFNNITSSQRLTQKPNAITVFRKHRFVVIMLTINDLQAAVAAAIKSDNHPATHPPSFYRLGRAGG